MKQLDAAHGIVCSVPDNIVLGYFGWPSLAKCADGSIVAACSGFRAAHVCACGKTVLYTSRDNGHTWDAGQIINDSMADDRDAGLLPLKDGRLLLSWFSSDVRIYFPPEHGLTHYAATYPVLEALNEEDIARYIGAFIRFRNTNGNWSKPQQVLASAPHGPIQLKNGDIFFLGTKYGQQRDDGSIDYKMGNMQNGLVAIRSSDGGQTWKTLGSIIYKESKIYEPHAIELKDGRLLGLIRVESGFSMAKTFSSDGGLTWTYPEPVTAGSPPHLMRLSNGVILCSYGWRRKEGGFGQRVMFSRDEGETWDTDWIIRNDGEGGDLGYPATVELDNGTMLTVYYQHLPGCRHASILYSHWHLPQEYLAGSGTH